MGVLLLLQIWIGQTSKCGFAVGVYILQNTVICIGVQPKGKASLGIVSLKRTINQF